MQNIQDIFNRMADLKKEQKEIKKMYREALANSAEYKEASEELKTLREKKKGIENSIKSDFSEEMDRLDILKADIDSDQILINDIALTKIANGESVEIIDGNNVKYEPIFNVSFKKVE